MSLVMEHFDVVEQLHLRVSVRVEPIGELTLHGGKEALHDGVVVAVTPAAHAADDPARIQGASAVIRQRHQGPFALHLFKAPQQELPKAHRLLHDPEHRLNRLLAQAVMRPGTFVTRVESLQ